MVHLQFPKKNLPITSLLTTMCPNISAVPMPGSFPLLLGGPEASPTAPHFHFQLFGVHSLLSKSNLHQSIPKYTTSPKR